MTDSATPAKRRPGRPPVEDPWLKVTLSLRASDVARIDALRGTAPRPEWIRLALLHGLPPVE